MKSARFLVVVLLLSVWGIVGCASFAYRQRPEKMFRVSGYVLDAVSRMPVPGVIVNSYGVVVKGNKSWRVGDHTRTDAGGHFVLRLPVRGRAAVKKVEVQDLLLNEGQAAIPADTTQQVVILLKRNAYRFEPYGCQRLADSAHVVPYVEQPILGIPGSQFVFLIRDSISNSVKPNQQRKVRSLTFRTGSAGIPREPFRVRIYQYKGPDQPPGEDLFTENFIICGKEGVFTYDLSSYEMKISGDSFFLGLEYTVGGDKFWCFEPMDNYTPTGPILRPPCARPQIRTWEYTIGKGWHRATAVENCWPFYESAISVEMEPASAKH